jgi:cytochrome c biogenesis protein CcmG/thiol:disulfide interchange protein DsbE
MSDTLAPSTPADADGDGGGRSGRSRIAPFVALGIAAVFALLFFVFARSDSGEAESADTRWLNQPAPDTTGRLAGTGGNTGVPERTWSLAQRSGSWVVLNFFDSTCGPCVAEHPELVDFDAGQDTRGAEQIELVSVLWGNDPARSFEYLQENGLDWDVVYDDGSIANVYGVTKVPETWIVDPNGYVRRRYIGEVSAQLLIDTVATFEAPVQ